MTSTGRGLNKKGLALLEEAPVNLVLIDLGLPDGGALTASCDGKEGLDNHQPRNSKWHLCGGAFFFGPMPQRRSGKIWEDVCL